MRETTLDKMTTDLLDQVALEMRADKLTPEDVADPEVVAAYISARIKRNKTIVGWLMSHPDALRELTGAAP